MTRLQRRGLMRTLLCSRQEMDKYAEACMEITGGKSGHRVVRRYRTEQPGRKTQQVRQDSDTHCLQFSNQPDLEGNSAT